MNKKKQYIHIYTYQKTFIETQKQLFNTVIEKTY